ncbi:MAG: restriction endonuclease subunit S [Saprospiraceae bacterium]
MMKEEMEIPKGWAETTLGEIAKKETLKVNPTDKPNAKFIGMDCIQANSMKVAFHYSFREFKSSGNWFEKNHVLYGRMRPYLNKVFRANYEGACSGEFIVLNCKENFYPDYLAYLLHHRDFVRFANSKTSGDRPRISFDEISTYPILLPPLPEQHRIVSKIEELFSSLDKGIESLKTAQAQLKVYRQAVLKWAFEGKLTNEEHNQLVSVDSVALVFDPQPSHRTPEVEPEGIPFVSIKDCDYSTGKIDFNNARKVSKTVLKEHIERYSLEIGDFIIGKIGTIGQPIQLTLPQNYTLSANVVLIQPRRINKKYLFYYFQSSQIEKEFKKGQSATAQAAFGIQKVRALTLNTPSPSGQQKVVTEIETRLSVCDKIEESISVSLQQAEALRQSILKKAFEGKLVPQDPRDEPAGVLLERIRGERERNISVKKVKAVKL